MDEGGKGGGNGQQPQQDKVEGQGPVHQVLGQELEEQEEAEQNGAADDWEPHSILHPPDCVSRLEHARGIASCCNAYVQHASTACRPCLLSDAELHCALLPPLLERMITPCHVSFSD